MFLAVLFVLLTGLAWMTISVTQANARHGNCPAELYYAIGSSCALAIALVCLAVGGGFSVPQWSWLVFICTILATISNSIANLTTMTNVGYGSAALYLALSSLGFVVSFLWSVVVWHEPMSKLNAFGMLCLLTAVILSALGKKETGKDKLSAAAAAKVDGDMRLVRKRLLLALASVITCGISQTLFVYPFSAKFNAPPLPPMMKTAFVVATYVLIYWSIVFARRRTYKTMPSVRTLATYPVIWGILAIVSYTFLFAALKYMGQIGRSGLTYPLCGAVQIFFFALFCKCVYKDKLTPRQIAALVLIIVGIFAVQM